MPTQTRRKILTFKILISIHVYILVVETYNMVMNKTFSIQSWSHLPCSSTRKRTNGNKTSHYGSDKMGPQSLKGVSQVSTCQHGAVAKRTRLTQRSVKHITEKPCSSDGEHLHVEKNEPDVGSKRPGPTWGRSVKETTIWKMLTMNSKWGHSLLLSVLSCFLKCSHFF